MLNPSTHARSGIYVQRKKTETHFSRKTKIVKMKKYEKKKEKRPQRGVFPERAEKLFFFEEKFSEIVKQLRPKIIRF